MSTKCINARQTEEARQLFDDVRAMTWRLLHTGR
jgi:hypothetical protein